ncbi:hypothetical protein LCGC14_2261200 [marine sediment metagenome]|uniref:IstB-like ATP-binding domain-containing protein n=1 Tax=marine sediment metagenome TaxID=412755 RepID=A0A0F9FC21_9ZZZZ
MNKEGLQPLGDSLPAMTPENGAPASPLVEEPECPICLDRQWVHPTVDGKVDYGDVKRCVCQKKNDANRKRLALLLGCKLPKDADRFTFDTFKVFPDLQEAYDACVAFASGRSDVEWLTLLAGVDKGKSHLAIAICHTFIKRGIPARYLFVPSGLDALRAGYDAEGEQGYEAQLRHMIAVDLLVLDDLGAQVPTPWAMEKLMMIIDERYMAGLPLVVTTNKALNMLPGDDEGRIGSRIMRHPHAQVITIKGPEYRMRSKT